VAILVEGAIVPAPLRHDPTMASAKAAARVLLAAHWPAVEIRVYERSTRTQLEGLRDGSLDMGIIALPTGDVKGLVIRKLEHASSMAAVPTRWNIGKRGSVRFSELGGFPFIMFPRSWNEEFLTRFHALCAKAGFVPNITQEAAQPYTMLAMVANELGITLLQSTARHLKVKGVRRDHQRYAKFVRPRHRHRLDGEQRDRRVAGVCRELRGCPGARPTSLSH
jgi:DNA-binding transcriptional LysR family regulator